VTDDVKYGVKLGRQNSVHVTVRVLFAYSICAAMLARRLVMWAVLINSSASRLPRLAADRALGRPH
jgi:hypothetical protein